MCLSPAIAPSLKSPYSNIGSTIDGPPTHPAPQGSTPNQSSAGKSHIVPIVISTICPSNLSITHARKNPVHPFTAASANHKLAAWTNSLLTSSPPLTASISSASAPIRKRWWRRPGNGSVADKAAAVVKKWMKVSAEGNLGLMEMKVMNLPA